MTCPLLRSDAFVIVSMRDDARDACCRPTTHPARLPDVLPLVDRRDDMGSAPPPLGI
jgi:hypothetical protein